MDDVMIGMDGCIVPGLPTSYDNIGEDGQVLYLDAERLARKEWQGGPVYQNRSGSVAQDLLWPRLSLQPWNYGLYAAIFHYAKPHLWRTRHPNSHMGAALRNIIMMDDPQKEHTGGTVINLNVDLSDKAESVVVPYDLVIHALEKADYIGAAHKCLCRTAHNCKHYPAGLGCLFLGKSGRSAVAHGIADEVSKEEAIARVDKAAELGLACMSLWVEIEQLVWGLRNDEMCDMVEICFCCPCCCMVMNLCKATSRDIRDRFKPSGFTATVDHGKCIGCYKCMATVCPQDALQVRASDGKVTVNQETCFGCGYCKQACPTDAIKIRQTMPMRESLHEYFQKERALDLVVD